MMHPDDLRAVHRAALDAHRSPPPPSAAGSPCWSWREVILQVQPGHIASFFFLAAYRVPVMASYYLRCRRDGRDALFTLGSASIPDETPLIDPGINGTDTPRPLAPLSRLSRAGVNFYGQLKNISVTVNHFNCRAPENSCTGLQRLLGSCNIL